MHTGHIIKVIKLKKYVFQHLKVWERNLVSSAFEKDDPTLTRKRKVSSHYEEEEAPVKLV